MIDRNKIREVVTRMHFPAGMGTKENACTVAALNIALYGKLTDEAPECASDVICEWVRLVQDAMPYKLRNSARWKEASIWIPGTGKAHELERLAIVLDHMWTVTLPTMQPLADAKGFGDAWRRMTTERTQEAAEAAARAAAEAVRSAAWAAEAAARAAAYAAAYAAAWAAWAAWEAARAAARAAEAARAASIPGFWDCIDPCAVLERLNAVHGC